MRINILGKKIDLLFLVLLAGVVIVFWYPTIYTPYWWDSAGFIIQAARYYINTNFSSVFLPADRAISVMAHPSLFPFLLALTWKIFGESLLVSHLFYLPFILLAVIFTYFLGKKIAGLKNRLSGHLVGFSSALVLLFSPLFLAQVGIIYTEIPVAAFSVMAVYFFLKRRTWSYLVSAILMLFMKEVSVVIILAILLAILVQFLIRFFKKQKRDWKKTIRELFIHGSPVLLLVGWFVWHKIATGWMFAMPYYQEQFAENIFRFSFSKIALVFKYFFWQQERPIITVFIAGLLILSILGARLRKRLFSQGLSLLFPIVIFVPLLFGKLEFLPRYLVFGLPFLYIALFCLLAGVFRREKIRRGIIVLGLIILFLICAHRWDDHRQIDNWHFPPLEENLEYLDMIEIGKGASSFIEKEYPEAVVYTGFPTNYMLSQPYQHYVTRPIEVHFCKDYKENGKVSLVVFHLFSPPQIDCAQVLRQHEFEEIGHFEKNDKWIKIYKRKEEKTITNDQTI